MRGVSSGKLIRTDEDPVEMNTKETEITPRSLSPGPMVAPEAGARGALAPASASLTARPFGALALPSPSLTVPLRTAGWRPGSAFRAAGWRPGSAFRAAGWRLGSAFRFFEISSTPLFAFALALDARCRLAAAARF
jgi:hypothetical protein